MGKTVAVLPETTGLVVQRLVAAAVAVAAAAPIGGDTKVPKSANGHKKGQEYLVDVRAEVRNRDGYSGEKEREREREDSRV